MRRNVKYFLILLTVFTLIISGCSDKKKEISFIQSKLPDAFPARSKTPYSDTLVDGNNIYLTVHRGEKRTGGYTVEILSITEEASGEVTVKTQFTDPESSDFVTLAITHPSATVLINKNDLKKNENVFTFVDEEGVRLDELGFSSTSPKEIPFKTIRLPENLPAQSKSPYYLASGQGEDVYLTIHRGEKRTGGYSLEVLSVLETAPGKVTVTVKFNDPNPTDFLLQAFTYPAVTVSINKKDLSQENTVYSFQNEAGINLDELQFGYFIN